jgi:hypothetical protein
VRGSDQRLRIFSHNETKRYVALALSGRADKLPSHDDDKRYVAQTLSGGATAVVSSRRRSGPHPNTKEFLEAWNSFFKREIKFLKPGQTKSDRGEEIAREFAKMEEFRKWSKGKSTESLHKELPAYFAWFAKASKDVEYLPVIRERAKQASRSVRGKRAKPAQK